MDTNHASSVILRVCKGGKNLHPIVTDCKPRNEMIEDRNTNPNQDRINTAKSLFGVITQDITLKEEIFFGQAFLKNNNKKAAKDAAAQIKEIVAHYKSSIRRY